MDKRRYPRKHLPLDFAVVVDIHGERMDGLMRDVSQGGTRIVLKRAPMIGNHVLGQQCTVEVPFNGGQAHLHGRIVVAEGTMIALAFVVPMAKSFVDQLPGRQSVRWQGHRAVVVDELYLESWREIMGAVRAGKELDLRDVSEINGSSLGVLHVALDRGATIVGCAPQIRDLLQVGKVCDRCNNHC